MTRDRLVSIQTTNERGGAEYANVDLLAALAARGHSVVLLTNVPDIASGTDVPAVEIDLGPKLARRSVLRVAWQAPMSFDAHCPRVASTASCGCGASALQEGAAAYLVASQGSHRQDCVGRVGAGPTIDAPRSGPHGVCAGGS